MSRALSYVFIVVGGLIAIYAQAEANQNQLVLIGGIVILMFGVYSVSRSIPSKNDSNEQEDQ